MQICRSTNIRTRIHKYTKAQVNGFPLSHWFRNRFNSYLMSVSFNVAFELAYANTKYPFEWVFWCPRVNVCLRVSVMSLGNDEASSCMNDIPEILRLTDASVRMFKHRDTQIFRYRNHIYSNTQIHKYSDRQSHRFTNTQIHIYRDIQIPRSASTQMHRCKPIEIYMYTHTRKHSYTNKEIHRKSTDRSTRIRPQTFNSHLIASQSPLNDHSIAIVNLRQMVSWRQANSRYVY